MRVLLFAIVLMMMSGSAFADCATATMGVKPEGYTFYNDDHETMQYCAGSVWRSVGAGGVGVPTLDSLLDVNAPTPGGGEVLTYNSTSGEWVPGGVSAGETDPQVGTLTTTKWCVTNAGGTAVDCTANAPVTTETDPQVGTLTTGKWCTTDGSTVTCTSDPPGAPSCTQRTNTTTVPAVGVGCLAGETMTGGGCLHTSGTIVLEDSYPQSATSWRCEWNGSGATGTAYAICCTF